MSSHIDSFVGRQMIVSIDDPWDFVSLAGSAQLEGKIITVEFSDIAQPRFLCSVSPFEMSGIIITQVVGVNRYIGSQDLVKELESGKDAIMNFVYRKTGELITPDDIGALISEIPGDFLIGSMTLTQSAPWRNLSKLLTRTTWKKRQTPPRAPLTNEELEHVTSHEYARLKLTDEERARLRDINKRREQERQARLAKLKTE